MKPNLIEKFTDNGEHSHWELVDDNGSVLWPLPSTPLLGAEEVAKIVVEKIGEYVNGLDRRNLGVPMMDEVAVMQMENIVEQILADPSKEVEIPEYD